MKVRLAVQKDKARILLLLSQLGHIINTYVSYDPKNEDAGLYGSENYDLIMKNKSVMLFVIEENKIILGVASVFPYSDMITGVRIWHIDDFVIDENKRRKGYGTFLMKGIMKSAINHQVDTIKLNSSLPLTYAHAFYEKMGGKFTTKGFSFTPISDCLHSRKT